MSRLARAARLTVAHALDLVAGVLNAAANTIEGDLWMKDKWQ